MGLSVDYEMGRLKTWMSAWAIGNASNYRSLGVFGISTQATLGPAKAFYLAEYRVSIGGDSAVHAGRAEALVGHHWQSASGFCRLVSSVSLAKDTAVFLVGLEPAGALKTGPVYPLISPRVFYASSQQGLILGGTVGLGALPTDQGFGFSIEAGLLDIKGPWLARFKLEKTLWQ